MSVIPRRLSPPRRGYIKLVIAALSGVKSEKMTMIIIMPLLPSISLRTYRLVFKGFTSYHPPYEMNSLLLTSLRRLRP